MTALTRTRLAFALVISHMVFLVRCTPPPPGLQQFECGTSAQSDTDYPELRYGPTCSEIVAEFPDSPTFEPAQDHRVMCPFTRMVHRLGMLARTGTDEGTWRSKVEAFASGYAPFGADTDTIAQIATLAIAGQNNKAIDEVDPLVDTLDVYRLYAINGTSHDCGFTFSLGATTIEPPVIGQTLTRLWELSYPSGEVSIEHLYQVQREACQRDYNLHVLTGTPTKDAIDVDNETLVPAVGAIAEAKLIFSYCGGLDQGFVLWSDVARLLTSRLPERKTKYLLDFALLGLAPEPTDA